MFIGVISYTHNDVFYIRKAIEFFNFRKANIVLHCGDIFSPSAALEFSKLNCAFKAVFGNNDYERAALDNVISGFGIIKEAPFEFKLDGKLFVMTHSPSFFDDKKYDYALFGHTHKPKIENIKGTLFINPGEACGHRYGRATAVLVDTQRKRSEIFDFA
ncbi:MAG: metallophosphoesterase [Endomicrobium sp.]|jgi:putative phosphoesterase|nr:metallophosphoesterase [Endomicrobium sp.]